MTKPIVAFGNFATAPKMEDISIRDELTTVRDLRCA